VTHHLSTSELQQFCVNALAAEELTASASHTADCRLCQSRFIEEVRRQSGSTFGNITLEPEFWFQNEHVDFDQLMGLADNSLDQDVQDIINIHLKTCETCQERVRSFLAFRYTTGREMNLSYGPVDIDSSRDKVVTGPWWQRLQSRQAYALAAVVLVSVALLIVVVALNRRSSSLQAGNNDQVNGSSHVDLSSSPSTSPAVISTPSIVDDSATIAKFRDARGEVTIDKNGRVTGLDELSDINRQQIARAALTERLDPATVLKELSGNPSGLRGNGDGGKGLRLLYPARRVVIEDLPVFKWEGLPNAVHYRVYVLDANGIQVDQSEELPPTQTQWKAPAPLRRGKIFSWAVTTLVDGNEIVSPSASAPEMKFAVLSTNDLQELSRLKKQNSHLALGVFYANVGLISEAERELQNLIRLNPQSTLPQKLLQSIRTMRKAK
jgi:hypothetical protein